MKPENKTSGSVTFTISLEEANKIFKALGNLPFVEVYELIGKLNEQANRQLSNDAKNDFSSNGSSIDIDQFFSDKN